MKVLACPTDRGGVGSYRLRNPIAVLKETEPSIEVTVNDRLPLVVNPDTDRVVGIGNVDCDVLILQLPMMSWIPDAIAELQDRGIKVIVEVDDDYQGLHPQHMSYYLASPGHSPERNWRHLLACCAQADLVTTSTPALAARYGQHGRSAVLRNYVPERFLDIKRQTDGRTVGWAGAVGVHPNDLQVTQGGVAAAVEESGARFLCIGSGEKVARNLSLRHEPEATGWLALDLYPYMLTRFDVGIAPLADTRFNQSKSWLKCVEYAAVGVPFVASDVEEYRVLNALCGLGELAQPRARSWRQKVKMLLADERLRRERSDQGRQMVRDHLTIERNAWKWAEVWSGVMDRVPA